MKETTTGYFISSMVAIDGKLRAELGEYMEGWYLGMDDHSGKPSWGENIYLKLLENTPEDLREKLKASTDLPYSEILRFEGSYIFVYPIPQEEMDTVIKPILKGKYSEVSKDYVEKYFPESAPKFRSNRLVFQKSDVMRDHWEKKLGVELPKDAEVWSIIDPIVDTIGHRAPADEALPPIAN